MSNRTVLVAALAASILIGAPFASAGTGDDIREGVRNPRSGDASQETQIIAKTGKDTYGTRQSNKGAGGGAIYGCRSTLDTSGIGDPKKSTACVRVNNLSSGKAFDFQSSRGRIIGIFQSGPDITKPKSDTAPFVTNATAVAVGLNADRVDGANAADIIAAARAKKGLDADTLDGVDAAGIAALVAGATCPADTISAGGGCIEKLPRAAKTYAAAAAECGGLTPSRRLVPPDVLLHARTLAGTGYDINLGAGEMSADLTPSAVAPVTGVITEGYATVNDAGAVGTAAQTAATAFRCITH